MKPAGDEWATCEVSTRETTRNAFKLHLSLFGQNKAVDMMGPLLLEKALDSSTLSQFLGVKVRHMCTDFGQPETSHGQKSLDPGHVELLAVLPSKCFFLFTTN